MLACKNTSTLYMTVELEILDSCLAALTHYFKEVYYVVQ